MSTSNPKSDPVTALQNLRNFCFSYNLMEADELLSRVFTVMLRGNYSVQSKPGKVRLLDYFEALEEVLPALYELREVLKDVPAGDMEDNACQDQASSKDLFTSFKRQPE